MMVKRLGGKPPRSRIGKLHFNVANSAVRNSDTRSIAG